MPIYYTYMDGIDPDVQTWLTYLSGSPSMDFITDVSNLVKDLKSCSAWTGLDRFWIHATEQQQHARISLKFPSSSAVTEVNSPTWNFSGYAGNGTTSYVNLNYNPSVDKVNMSTQFACIGVFVSSAAASTSSDIGLLNGALNNNLLIHARAATVVNSSANDNFNTTFNPGLSDQRALYVAQRFYTGGTNSRVDYVNGIPKRVSTVNNTPLQNGSVFLCCRNVLGSGAQLFTTRRQAISFVGGFIPDNYLFYLAIKRFADARGLPAI